MAIFIPGAKAGGGGGASDLNDLTDVNAPSPSTNQVLSYDGAEWIAATPSGGASELNDLTDVNAPTPTDAQVLTYDSGEWIAATVTTGGGASTLDELNDVSVPAPTDGQALVYDANSSPPQWVAATPSSGGGIPEAPIDSNAYIRMNGAWEIEQWDNVSEATAVFATASSGNSFVVGDAVQLFECNPNPGSDGSDPRYSKKFDKMYAWVAGEIQPSTAYALPESVTCRAGTTTTSYKSQIITSSVKVASKFVVKDMTSDTGAVDWIITRLRLDGKFTNDEKAAVRMSIYDDNVGEPGSPIWDYNNFDWSEFINDGENTHDAYPTTEMLLVNGATYWIVAEYAGTDSNAAMLRGLVANGGYNLGSEYIQTPIEVESVKKSIDTGATWALEPDEDLLRFRIYADRATEILPPSSLYGVVHSDLDETNFGVVVLQGGVIGDTSGAKHGETWNDNDTLYVDIDTHQLTNVKPVEPLDVFVMARVLKASANDGSMAITAQTSAQRGVFMQRDIYDPLDENKDIFNLNNITRGGLEAVRVGVDDSNFINIMATDAQSAFDFIDFLISNFSLDNLVDANVPNPQDGQVLTFDTSTSPGMWIASTSSAASNSYDNTQTSPGLTATTVQGAIDELKDTTVEEAPIDDKNYVRINAAWAERTPSPIGGLSLSYSFDDDTTAADPGSGNLRVNNIDHPLATEIYVNKFTRPGNDASLAWDTIRLGQYIGIWENTGNREGIYYYISGTPVNNVDWYTVPITHVPGTIGGMDNGRNISAFIIDDPAEKIPLGGTTGQVLAKESDSNYHTEWVDSGSVIGTVTDWGDTPVDLGSVGGGTSNVDLDNGHVITATLTASHIINFTSTAAHASTGWEVIVDVTDGAFVPTFQFGGVAIGLPDGWDTSTSGKYWVVFRKVSTEVFMSERRVGDTA